MDREIILSSPKGKANSRYIKKNFPKEYQDIIKCPGDTFSEQLYNYFYGSPQHICPVCGKNTPFRNIMYGYSEFCSITCSYKGESRIKKAQQTCLERYGVKNPSQSKEIQKKKEDTCLKNYGVKSGFQLQDKFEETCLERYGVKNPSQSKEIQKKKEDTCLKNYGVKSGFQTEARYQSMMEKYGVDNPSLVPELQEKKKKTWRANFLKKHQIHIGFADNGDWICQCPYKNCDKCIEKQFIIPQQVFNDRRRNQTELCTKLLPIGHSNQGTTLELFVQNILDEYGIEYQTNVRDIIPPKEVDIYIPSKNIAIECNGIYWHSYKDPQYHIAKYSACRKTGVQLLTIWEDWIRNKPEVVKSILKSKLGLIERKIYARHCSVKVVDSKTCKLFLDSNHIQGSSPSSIKLGLYYNDELVSLMTFSKSRMGVGKNEDGYELVRFCNLGDTNTIGGASKLLKYFIKQYNPTKIISYSSNDISNGHLYETLGFHSDHVSSGAYWYISQNNFERYHRLSFCKSRLKDLGYDTEGKTESQIMLELPYWRIYDSGTTRWVLLFNK